MKLLNGANVLARLARSDINTPDFTGCPLDKQIREVRFEAAVYKILRSEPRTKVSRLLYYSVPELQEGVSLEPPRDIDGRRLMVFERAEGENNVWDDLSPAQQVCILAMDFFPTQADRCAYNLLYRHMSSYKRLTSVQQSSTSSCPYALPPSGSANASSSGNKHHSPFRLHQPVTSVLLFSHP